MGTLTEIIKQVVKQAINESISDIVYHFCNMASGYNICKTNKIFFTPTIQSQAESDINKKNSFFLSTTRQRNSMFGYSNRFSYGSSVRITLDGKKLRQNLSGKPIDYWYSPMGGLPSKQSYYNGNYAFSTAQKHASNESEDRIFSQNQVLENANKYILGIDVLIQNKLSDAEKKAIIDKFLATPLSNMIKIFDNSKDFNSLDGKNAINNKYDFVPNETIVNQINGALKLYDGFYPSDKNNKYLEIMGSFLYIIFCDKQNEVKNREECERKISNLLKKYHLDELLPNVPSYYERLNKNLMRGYMSSTFQVTLSYLKGFMDNPNETTEKLTKLMVDYCRSIGAYSIKDLERIKKASLMANNNQSEEIIKCTKFYSCGSQKSCEAIVLDNNGTPFYNVIERIAFGDKETADYNINDAIRCIANDFEEENYAHKSKNIESFKKYLYHVFKYGSVSDTMNVLLSNSNLMELFKYHFYIYPQIEHVELSELIKEATWYDEYQKIVDFPIEWREDKIREALEERLM